MDTYLKDQFDFTGVKAALLVEQSILVILRDNKPDIPWPNTWELPGGGREGQETPLECLQREVWEELGLALKEESRLFGRKSILVCWIKIGQLFLWLAKLAKSSIVRFVLVTRGRNLN